MTAFLTLMKGFLFFSRVAFILNILFFVCLFLRYKSFISSQEMISILLAGGWFFSLLVNILLHFWLMILLFMKKLVFQPWKLITFNLAVFIFQLLYFFL